MHPAYIYIYGAPAKKTASTRLRQYNFEMINKTFTFKLFSSDKFGFASNIWACLSANITIH
jgi:hypothetical protein